MPTGCAASATARMPSTSGRRKALRMPKPFRSCPPISSLLSPTGSGGPAVTLDEILASLFPDGHDVRNDERRRPRIGEAAVRRPALVVGVADRTPLGVDEADQAFRLRPGVDSTQGQRPDPRARRQRQPAHEQARRAARAERVSRPSRQSADPCGHERPPDHRHSVRPLGCRALCLRRRWRRVCWSDCPAPIPR